jgi:hypothetical protein
MAIHPIPDNDKAYMSSKHGTSYLITDPRCDVYLKKAHMRRLKEMKEIKDAWTI